MEGFLEAYLLTGRHGIWSSYESFVHVIDSNANQHAKWLEATVREIPWRKPIASMNLLAPPTSGVRTTTASPTMIRAPPPCCRTRLPQRPRHRHLLRHRCEHAAGHRQSVTSPPTRSTPSSPASSPLPPGSPGRGSCRAREGCRRLYWASTAKTTTRRGRACRAPAMSRLRKIMAASDKLKELGVKFKVVNVPTCSSCSPQGERMQALTDEEFAGASSPPTSRCCSRTTPTLTTCVA